MSENAASDSISVARQLLDSVMKEYEQWLELFDAGNDSGTWYELLVKSNLFKQLELAEQSAQKEKDNSTLSDIGYAKARILSSLNEAVDEYTERYVDSHDKSRYFEVTECLGIEPQIKYRIYCYYREGEKYGDEYDIIGFMDAENHAWDNECFHTIEHGGTFSDGIEEIFDEIDDDFQLECINSDNHNYQCYFTGDADKLIKRIKRI